MNIDKLIKVINDGELAVIPTDTVYGLIGDATNEVVINKVYEIKKRPKSKALIILVSCREMLERYINSISFLEEEIIKKYWPGPLTILFEKNKILSNELTANSKYIGIRLPHDKELLELISKLDKPIIATSANISSKETVTDPSILEGDIIKNVAYIWDIGTIKKTESTIIQVKNNKIIFLRDGALTSKIKEEFKDYI